MSSGNGQFLSTAQRKTNKIIMPIEPLYAASIFGLLAINIFTTTGMRVNEAMQIRLSGDYLVRVKTPAPPTAQDQSPRIRYVLRLIPKGERSDKPSNYYVGQETLRVMTRVAQMLIEDYGLTDDDSLPSVPYDPHHSRSHRFGAAPYLFQYKHRHVGGQAIAACMRFLLHGMSFITRDGQQVIIKPHLLRHAFATHAVQVEEIPIDIVGAMLQQKNVDITKYYSQATDTMVAEAADTYLSRIAAHVDVGEVMLRLPEELQQLYAEASGRAGTLTEVIGGQCVSHGYCVAKFACVGCAGKVPDPRKRAQVEHKKKWAAEQIEFATAEGLLPAAERMKQLVRDCEAELVEMDQIEAYRQDETRVPVLKLEPQQSPGGSVYTHIYVCS